MKTSFEKLKQELKARDIPLSFQRLKVLEYLTNNRCHPTVDRIFTDLHGDIPTLSKTTVYNTVKMLVKEGLVRALSIDEYETRYDIVTEDHGHFKCESCGDIYDFGVNTDAMSCEGLTDFQINNRDVYFKGICKRCLENSEKSSEEVI